VLGYGRNNDGSLGNTGTILKHFDFKQMGIAWHGDLSPAHIEVVKEIKSIMLQS
jgi:hypothetical protein